MEPERTTTPASRELVPRIISGVILAIAATALTWAGVWPFALFVLAVALLVVWEWGGIVRKAGADTIFVVSALSVTAAVLLTACGTPGLGLITIVVGAILASLLGFGQRGHLSSLGVLYAGLASIALIWLRADGRWGFVAVMFLLIVVWATDTAAYATGRTFGGPRLAPSLSPNKTWSGLLGGVVAAAIIGAALGYFIDGGHAGRMAITAAVLALVAQAGDITESALKREHDVKNASELIPGHGGFMDRVDGLIFAAVLAALFGAIVNVHDPARALLIWH